MKKIWNWIKNIFRKKEKENLHFFILNGKDCMFMILRNIAEGNELNIYIREGTEYILQTSINIENDIQFILDKEKDKISKEIREQIISDIKGASE